METFLDETLKTFLDEASLGIRIDLNAVLRAGLTGRQCDRITTSEILLRTPPNIILDDARFALFDQMIRELPERIYGHPNP